MRLFTLVLYIVCSSLFAQSSKKVDSVRKISINHLEDSVRADANLKLFSYYRRRNTDSSLYYAKKAYQCINTETSNRLRSIILNDLSLAFKVQGQIDSALFYKAVQRDIVYLTGDSLLIGKYHNNVGNIYQNIGDKLLAHENYLTAMKAFKSVGDAKEVANAQNNIAINFLIDGEYKKGLKYLFDAYYLRDSIGDTNGVIGSLSNIGITFKDLKKYDSALIFLNESLEKSIEAENVRGESTAHNNLSVVYLRLNDYESSLKHQLKAITLNQQSGRKPGLLNNYINVATTYYEEKDYQKAIEYAEKGDKLSDEIQSLVSKKKANQLLGQVYQSLGKYEKAIAFFNIHDTLKDSIYNISKTKQLQELEEQYQSSVKDKQITALELEKKNAALILAKSNNQRNVLIAVSCIVIIVAILLFVLFRQKRKSLEERDVLLKEIHHRVKNNLQVISSLLNLQADSLDDDVAKDAVKEGQHRVKSMALIHQKLYSADDVRGVNVQGYLEQLSTELFKAFGIDEEKVSWKIDTSGLKMDIDTVIPLGLIINELITNSIKYAFQNADHGLLEISMKEEGENLNVFVKDNGAGMNEEAMKASNSFGWKMIKSLGRKLKADISVDSVSGTIVQLKLARYKLVS